MTQPYQLSPVPLFRVQDNNNRPLSGGQVFTYIAGTTTPQASYPSPTSGSPNPNPVVLNARGEAAIWLDPALTYKIQVTDSGGNQIPGYPVDNIPGGFLFTQQGIGKTLFPQTAAEIAAAITPSNYAYPQLNPWRYGADGAGGSNDTTALASAQSVLTHITGTGTNTWKDGAAIPEYPRSAAEIAASIVPTNFQYPPLNVLRYGADPTAASDSTQAFLNAIAVTQHVPFGAVVRVPQGDFLVNSTGVFLATTTQQNFEIIGDSTVSSRIINGAAAQPAIRIGDGGGTRFRVWIRDLCIAQSASVGALSGNYGVFMNKVGQGGLQNIYMFQFPGALNVGVHLLSCTQVTIENVQVGACLNNGIELISVTDVYATDCRSDGNGGSGWFLDGSQGGYYKACTTFNNSNTGWTLSSTNAAVLPNFNNDFHECVGDTSGNYNWQINDSINSNWIECWGSTQQSTLVNTTASGFFINSQYCRQLDFVGCQAHFNNGHGFQVFDPGSSAPTYLSFISCEGGTFSLIGGNNGNGQGGSGSGLALNGLVSHVRISGGMYLDNATSAIAIATSGGFVAQDIIITDNPMGYVSQNQGTATIATSATTVTVTHGLSFTPSINNINVTPQGNIKAAGSTSFWTSAAGATTFVINVDTALTGNVAFTWAARFPGS